MKIALECTHDDFHGLTLATDDRRKTPVVKVQRDALARLMRDHQKLVAYFKGELIGDT